MFMQPFFSTFLNLVFLIFRLDSIEFLKCMIWQSNFSFLFFVFSFLFSQLVYFGQWRILNYQVSGPIKTHFSLPNFWRIWEINFLNQGFSCSLPQKHDKKVYAISKTCAPQSTKAFYSNCSKVKESVYQDGFITNNDH